MEECSHIIEDITSAISNNILHILDVLSSALRPILRQLTWIVLNFCLTLGDLKQPNGANIGTDNTSSKLFIIKVSNDS